MTAYIIPLLMLALICYSVYKKNNTYQSFVNGAKEAIQLVLDVFPYIATVLICVELFKISGLSEITAQGLSPFFSLFGIPKELTEFIILRPFTGSGSIALFHDICTIYGPDSYIARVAAAIMGSSETVFYVSAVYFSSTSVKRTLYAIPVALFACFVGAVAAALVCLVM